MVIHSIVPYPKCYEWGLRGEEAITSKIYKKAPPNKLQPTYNPASPYAELWYGTHPSGESVVSHASDDVELLSTLLGGTQLSYLLKLLSIGKPLSIQCHPNLEQAANLHKQHPLMFPDPNHKPEIAISLTSFTGLCGFRETQEILSFVNQIPTLKSVIPEGSNNRKIFQTLIQQDSSIVNKVAEECKELQEDVVSVFQSLYSHYPGDPGCLMAFMLNFIQLEPGQCLYIEPRTIHAYLSGQIIECMACSDNVLRCGLTPKEIHVDLISQIANFESTRGNIVECVKVVYDDKTCFYSYAASGFAVHILAVGNNHTSREISILKCCSPIILCVLKGCGTLINSSDERKELTPGDALVLTDATTPFKIITVANNVGGGGRNNHVADLQLVLRDLLQGSNEFVAILSCSVKQ